MYKMTANEIINELSKYKKYGVVVMGPKGVREKQLRVYANGGDIGRISIDDDSQHEIHKKKDYLKYLFSKKDNKKLLELIEEAKGKVENPRSEGEILCDADYLACMLKATNYKFHNCKKENNYQLIKSERLIGTTLISKQNKIKNESGNLLIYDMEYAIKLPTRTKKNKKGEIVPKKSEPDFIVFDGKNIGFVELKYDADNMTADNSLEIHFEDFMDFIWNGAEEDKWKIIDESIYRLECLRDAGLIDESWHTAIKELREWYDVSANGVFCAERIWIGFYFVEGPNKSRNKKPCKEYVEDEIRIQLGEAMKKARKKQQNTKVLYGYWKNDEDMKFVFDKEIIVDEVGNISFEEL